MLTRQQKREKIDKIKENISNSPYIFYTTFSQIKTKDVTKLRNNLFGVNSKMALVKKSLADIAFKELNIENVNLKKGFNGQAALVFSDENLFSALSFLNTFKKANKDKFEILGAILNKETVDKQTLSMFTSIKSQDDLYTRLV
ncbi:MAG: 50S ribosomal protein L10 [Candidatus Paceibacterota bacterium]|jgi:large subunit ribosomal protein L10